MALRRIVCSVGCVSLLCATLSTPAFGIVGESYQYKVRVFEGNRGDISAPSSSAYPVEDHGDYIEFTIPSGGEFSLDTAWDKVSPEYSDIYYVKGYRVAGADYGTDNRLESLNRIITEDTDFVVAYGVIGRMVDYHVVYVDESGAEIGRSKTYQGSVGDRPVVAYEHIEGYRPLYRNITGTLVDGENEWRLPYRKIESLTSTTTVTTVEGGSESVTVSVPGPSNPTGGTSSGTAGGTTSDSTTGATTSSDEVVGTTSGGTESGKSDVRSDDFEPEDILDNDNPMTDSADGNRPDSETHGDDRPGAASNGGHETERRDGLPLWFACLVVMFLIAIPVLFLWLLLMLRRRDDSDSLDE